jgi:hypothetical protein
MVGPRKAESKMTEEKIQNTDRKIFLNIWPNIQKALP